MKNAATIEPRAAESRSDASTRRRVASSLLEHGPSTAAQLAERLHLTAAAVRRHLDVLLESGAVGRVTPDGTITEFPLLAPNAGAAGITAGADRRSAHHADGRHGANP